MNTVKNILGYAPLRKKMAHLHLLFWLLSATTLTSCNEKDKFVAPKEEVSPVWLLDRLYFGRAISAGGEVSEADWDKFIAEIVTPRFPDGLTFWRVDGQYQDASGIIIREPSFILEIAHEKGEPNDLKLKEIIAAYKQRFQQQSVLRITEQIEVEF